MNNDRDTESPVPAWLSGGASGALTLAAIVAFIAFFLLRGEAVRWTADESAGEVSVWLLTPHVGPGGRAVVDVGVYGGARAGIEEATIEVNGVVTRAKGRGAYWGSELSTKWSDSGSASLEVPFQVPPGATSTLEVKVTTSYVLAITSGGTFDDAHRTESLVLRAGMDGPLVRAAKRIADAVGALAVLALAAAAIAASWRRLVRIAKYKDTDSRSQGAIRSLVLIFIVGAIAYGYLGYALFALPLVAATDVTSGAFTASLVLFWLAGPPVFAHRRSKREPPSKLAARLRPLDDASQEDAKDYRAAATGARKTASLVSIAGALRAIEGARVAVRKGKLTVRRRAPRGTLELAVPDPARITAAEVSITTDDPALAVVVSHALVGLLGAHALDLDGHEATIDGSRGPDEIAEELLPRMLRADMARLDEGRRALEAMLRPERDLDPAPRGRALFAAPPAPRAAPSAAKSYHPANGDIVGYLKRRSEAGSRPRAATDERLARAAQALPGHRVEAVYEHRVVVEKDGIVCAASLGDDGIALRVPPEARAEALAAGGSATELSDWIRFDPGDDAAKLARLCAQAHDYARALAG